MPSVPPLRKERLYESLAAHISDFIEAQGLVGGDRLPPERQLAAELGVSRATLSRALAALETRGRIETRHGVGTMVRESPDGPTLTDRVASRPREEVLAAREAMLAGIARAAASHPQSALRLALLADDGTVRSFGHTWRCVRRLAGSDLLADLDDLLAVHAPDPADHPDLSTRLDRLAQAVIAGDPGAAATACVGLLDRSGHDAESSG